jgi:signal transduction histidine kinase
MSRTQSLLRMRLPDRRPPRRDGRDRGNDALTRHGHDVRAAVRLLWKVACAIAFLLTGACGPATGTMSIERDAVVERAWLDDPAGTLSPEAALGRVWTPFDGSLSRGYVTSSTWLRLRINPAAAGPPSVAADRRLVLGIMPSHLDEIAVYRADRLSEPPELLGDAHPASTAGTALLSHAVVFDEATAPFEVLLRLRTQSTHSIDVQALRWEDAHTQSLRIHTALTAVLVFTLMVMAWAASVWLERRDPLVGLFIVHEAAALLVSLLTPGALRLYAPDWLTPALDQLTSFAIPLSALVAVRFHARLLADLDVRKREPRLLRALTLGPLAGLALVALGYVRVGLMINQLSLPAVVVLLVVTAWRARMEPASAQTGSAVWRRGYLIAVYVVMATLTLPQSMRALGLLPAQRWSFLGFAAYSVASALLMGLLLAYRASAKRARRRRDEVARQELAREAAAQRARATEQSELLTMLSHELRTPLSVVTLALGDGGPSAAMRARALRAVDNMREVVDRCEQTARYDDDVGRLGTSPAFAPVALDEVLDATLEALGRVDGVDRLVAAGLPACHVDRQMAQIVVGNLLENAFKYGPPDARVRASLAPAEREGCPGVALRIANRVGAAGRPDAAHVFEKYHRGPRARHRSGSGLGLYLSHRLTSRLGGALTLRDADADEVEFELWLPSRTAPAAAAIP